MEELTETFYTIQEAADLLKVHHNTVRSWIKSGQIRAVKIGRSYRIPKSQTESRMTSESASNH